MADLYYIEDDYFTPDGYFVYTADAVAAVLSESSLACELTNVTVTEALADLVSEFNVNAEALKILSSAVELTASFSQSTVGVKTTESQTAIASEFAQSTAASKTVNAVIDAVTLFSTSVSALVTSANSIDITSSATMTVEVTVTRATSVALSNIVALSLQAAKISDNQAAVSSTATVTATVQVISPSVIVSIVSQFSQSTAATRTRTSSAASNSEFTQTTAGNRFRFGLAQSINQFTLSAQSRKTVRAVSAFTVSTTVTASLLRLRRTTVSLASTATETVTARATKRAQATITSIVNIALDITEFNIRDVFIQSIIPPTGVRPLDLKNTTDDQGNSYMLAPAGQGNQQIVLTKYSSRGKLVFKKKTQLVPDEGPIAITYSNQNIYTMWSIYDTANLQWRIELSKWDLFGNVLASRRINNHAPGSASDIKVFEGSVYVSSVGISSFLIKFDTNFNLQWHKTYNFGTNQRNNWSNLWIDSTGITWVGYNDYIGYDTRFTRINATTGNIVTTQLIDSASQPLGQEVVRDSAGNYYIGMIIAYKQGILKLDTNRQPVWLKVYDGSYFQTYSEPSSLSIDSNDNLYFTYEKTGGIGSTTSIARGIVSMTKDGAIRYDATLDISTPYSRFENTDLRINGDFFQLSGIAWTGGTPSSPDTMSPTQWVLYQDQITNYLGNWTRTACGLTYTWTTNTAGTVSDIISYSVTDDPTFSQSNYSGSYSSSSLTWTNATDYTECVVWVPLVGRSAMSSRFTSTVVARRNIGPIISSMPVRATMSVTAVKTARVTRTLSVAATTTTNNSRIRRQIAYLNSVATVSPRVRKIVGTGAGLTARVTTNQSAVRTLRTSVNITAFNTVASANVKNATGTILMESRATLSCLAVKTGEIVVQSTSNATVTASFLKQPQPRQYSFALGVTATMSVTARKTVNPPTYLTVNTTATVDAIYIIVNTFPISAAFTLTVNPVSGKIVTANWDAKVTVTADTLRSKIVYGVVNITAFSTEVVIGTKVTIDPYLTLWVPPETAAKKVTQETALLTVDSENRVNIITHEQRNIIVPTETSTWHLPTAKVVGVRRIK